MNCYGHTDELSLRDLGRLPRISHIWNGSWFSKEIFEVVKAGLGILEQRITPGTCTEPWQLNEVRSKEVWQRAGSELQQDPRSRLKRWVRASLGEIGLCPDVSSSKPLKNERLCQKHQWEVMRVRIAEKIMWDFSEVELSILNTWNRGCCSGFYLGDCIAWLRISAVSNILNSLLPGHFLTFGS